MLIPDDAKMTATIFGDLSKGGYFRCYRNEEFGIDHTVSAETRNSPAILAWAIDCLPDQTFDTIMALREAVKELPDV